ncbi:MAG: gliding motility-associated C-terminal domain-containing protein [Bacteroidia bacterium]|nr:gliding motility-associated C-terminal domain-containing protein [Bacteroidia bacterium]
MFISFAHGQKAGSKVWYFGLNAGIDFTQNPPLGITNGSLSTNEGCAAVTDLNGKLYFYTDGRTVYDKTHNTMSNGTGLNGDPSSTQSAVAVADPSNVNKYYVFTVDAFAGSKGLCYSIIDMSINGGLGAVTVKNTLLKTPVCEKITAVRKPFSAVVWIITRGWDNDSFHIYKLDSVGCNFYKSQSIGTLITGSSNNSVGYLKSNIQGTKIAYACYQGFAELFDFDPTTATFSNPIKLNNLGNAYGVEFSKNGTLLYVGSSTYKKVWQYNLAAGSPASIVASKIDAATIIGQAVYALQMGPDGIIYMAVPSNSYVSSIPNPEILGTGCGYIQKAIDLKGKLCAAGLPNALNSDNFSPYSDFKYQAICAGKAVNFKDTFDFVSDSIRWYFGLNGKNYLGSSVLHNPQFTFPKSGTYTVKLEAWLKRVKVDSVSKTVVVPDTIRDTINIKICDGDSIKIGNKYCKNTGDYFEWLTSYLGCDSVVLKRLSLWPKNSTTLNKTICAGSTYNFFGTDYSSPGTYTHILKNTNGCDSIITLKLLQYPKSEMEIFDTICSGILYPFYGQFLSNSGTYTKTFTSYTGCDSTVKLNLFKRNSFTYNISDTFCLKDTYIFNGIILTKPGIYSQKFVAQNGCDSVVKLNLQLKLCYPVVPCIIEIPNAITPDGNNINDVFKPVFSCNVVEYRLRIVNRWGEIIYSTDNMGEHWDGFIANKPIADGVYAYIIDVVAQQSLDLEKHHYEGTIVVLK